MPRIVHLKSDLIVPWIKKEISRAARKALEDTIAESPHDQIVVVASRRLTAHSCISAPIW